MRRVAMVLLSMGVVFGFGSGFARMAHMRHHGECGGRGGWESRWDRERDEGFRRDDVRPAAVAAPAPVPQTVVVQSPAPAPAPAPQVFIVMPGSSTPVVVQAPPAAAAPAAIPSTPAAVTP